MCRSSQGEYGVDEGLMFSFPCRRESGELRETGDLQVVKDISFNEYSQMKFNETLNELRHERDMVKDMGLLD